MSLPCPFTVCIHDVCPTWRAEVRAIFAAIAPLVGPTVALAAIPRPPAAPWRDHPGMAAELLGRAGEVLLHGCTHRRQGPVSPHSWLLGRCDEFAGLSAKEAESRIGIGVDELRSVFGQVPEGFVAPAWRMGRVTPAMLRRNGIRYRMGWASLATTDEGRRRSLVTHSWDCGRIGWAGWLSELGGQALAWQQGAVPCVVIHPADVKRGFLVRAIRRIESLLAEGHRPALPKEIAGT